MPTRAWTIGWSVFGLSLVALIGAVIWDLSWRPQYDTSHADYGWIDEQLAVHREGELLRLDLSKLNGGDWSTACLLGGYSHPVATMKKKGAKVSSSDQARFQEIKERRIFEVEEYELVLAFIDGADKAHFIHFRRGLGVGGQHFESCIDRAKREFRLGRNSSRSVFLRQSRATSAMS